MRQQLLGPLVIIFFSLLLDRGPFQVDAQKHGVANLPPRGWNSYDSFDWVVSEEEFLQNAEILSKRLLSHGYEYVVVDFLWYRRNVKGAYTDSEGFDVIDEWGRVIPDPGRWPSSKGGNGFKEVARKVHDMGLKFGIHVMRGISTQTFNANTPILDSNKGAAFQESGRIWRAKDIGMKDRVCRWMPHGFMSVNTELEAGRAFLRSLYQQYAEWDVDFVKHDCVFGTELDIKEISTVSEILQKLSHPVVYSLSPGTGVTPAMAKEVSSLVNMYRLTNDDWDKWDDVEYHFDIARDIAAAHLIGAEGLNGRSWPDLDMLPLGWLTDPGSGQRPHRRSNLSLDEQRTQMTLWSMVKSPLIYGGDLRKLDENTFNLITNSALLEINHFSENNMEFSYISAGGSEHRNHIISDFKNLKDTHSLSQDGFGLTSCKDPKATGWVGTPDIHSSQVCWKDSLEWKNQTPFCLRRRLHLKLHGNNEAINKVQYHGKFHLLWKRMPEYCIQADSNRRLTLLELAHSSLAPCELNANQMWKLNLDGTIVNSYSGLCAKVKPMKGTMDSAKIRSWIATGRRGEIYVAFFNLGTKKRQITARTEDLGRVLKLGSYRCAGREIWSGKNVSEKERELSASVESHGCALFVLNCN